MSEPIGIRPATTAINIDIDIDIDIDGIIDFGDSVPQARGLSGRRQRRTRAIVGALLAGMNAKRPSSHSRDRRSDAACVS